MEASSLTYKTFKNISYNVIGYVWPMAFALFVTPIIIFRLGVKEYGIYLFINAVIALLGLIEFGVSIAILKRLAAYYGKSDEAGLRRLVQTSNSIMGLIAVAGFGVSAFIAFGGAHLLPGQFAAYAQYSSLFLIAGGIFFVNTVWATYSIILTALQRFDLSNKIGIATVTLSSLSMLAIVLEGGSLQAIFAALFAVSLASSLAMFWAGRKALPVATFRFGWDAGEVRSCYAYGAVAFINNIATTALASLDRLIIPFFAGPSNLTYYSVPGNVTGKIPGFANTLATIMFPMASQLDGSGDRQRLETLYIRSFRLITIVAAALAVTAIAFSHQALLYWLNADFAARSSGILVILALTNFILALFGPLSNFLLGIGKLKFLTAMSVFMGLLNAALLVALLPRWGIVGAAWAYLLSVLPVAYMFYRTERRYLSLSGRKRYYLRKALSTLATGALVWAIDAFALSHIVGDLWSLLSAGAVSLASYILIYKALGFFEPEDWRDMELFFAAAVRRVRSLRA